MKLSMMVDLPSKFLDPKSKVHFSKKMHAALVAAYNSDWAAKAAMFAKTGSADTYRNLAKVDVHYSVSYTDQKPTDGEAFIRKMQPAIDGLKTNGILADDCELTYRTTCKSAWGKPCVVINLEWEA